MNFDFLSSYRDCLNDPSVPALIWLIMLKNKDCSCDRFNVLTMMVVDFIGLSAIFAQDNIIPFNLISFCFGL